MASQSPYEVFREMPDHLACVLTWWDGEKVQFHVVVNPSSTEDDAEGLTEWFAGVARRIEEYGLSRAVEMDGWQLRSDGAYQLWVRSVPVENIGF